VSERETRPAASASEPVNRAAGLYAHINDLLDAQGRQLQGVIHYHLGLQYATEALAEKLADLGVDAAWHLLDVCCGWGVPTRYLAGRFGCRITGVDITQRSIEHACRLTRGTDLEPRVRFLQGDGASTRTRVMHWRSAREDRASSSEPPPGTATRWRPR
jgi:hypothetical protein